MSKENLALWNAVEKTDPKYTKGFSKGGGFKGTATNATWLHKRATEEFGPMGIGWGVNVLDEKYVDGAAGEKVHVVRIKLWYIRGEQRGEIEAFGQTMFVGKNKNGAFTDEEAPKKSLTDATSKALSHLGFAADIHMGLYDDNKYVNDLRDEFSDKGGKGGKADAPEKLSYDDQLKLEADMKAEIDKFTTSKAVTDYMLSKDTQSRLDQLADESFQNVRNHAKKRLDDIKAKANQSEAG